MQFAWSSLDPAWKGFVAVSLGLLFLTLFVWLMLGRICLFLSPKPIETSGSVCESSEWMNFIISRLAPHFRGQDSRTRLEKLISSAIAPRSVIIHSLGNPPEINDVTTLELREADDIRFLIPIEWRNGLSLDLILKRRLALEIDIHKFKGQILVNCPGNSDRKIDVRFNRLVTLDFDMSMKLFNRIKISLTETPFLGTIVKRIAALILSRRQFRIDLPAAPATPNS